MRRGAQWPESGYTVTVTTWPVLGHTASLATWPVLGQSIKS